MKRLSLTRNTNCFLVIFLCFLWTSSGYLTWLYRLLDLMPGPGTEIATEVVGYLFQALGLLIFALAVRVRPKAAGKKSFSIAVGADLLLLIGAGLSRGLTEVLVFGYGMNLFHGIVAGFYLHRLAVMVEWPRRGTVFGLGYGAASVGAWLLSLFGGGNFLRSGAVLVVYVLMAAVTAWVILNEKQPAEEPSPSDRHDFTVRLLLLAGATVFLLSLVKNLGFSFPAADLSQGISLELSRVFYAAGLVIAGIVSDRERKYGAICCVASLGIPFLMIALTNSLGPSILFWILNYFFFGFFTVFRVVLFSDISRRSPDLLYLAGFGLLFGRLGDTAGSFGCIALSGSPMMLVVLTAILYTLTILAFFMLYQKIYTPSPLQEKNDQEVFDAFSEKYDLSSREREVLQLVLEGQSSPEIAESLYISGNTVKFHVRNLLKKTGCDSRVSLVALYRKTFS